MNAHIKAVALDFGGYAATSVSQLRGLQLACAPVPGRLGEGARVRREPARAVPFAAGLSRPADRDVQAEPRSPAAFAAVAPSEPWPGGVSITGSLSRQCLPGLPGSLTGA